MCTGIDLIEQEKEMTMKRMHVHIAVADIADSVRFYSALFAAEPIVLKNDYAKWLLDDPRVNFAISARGRAPGLDHLGVQVESDDELREMQVRLTQAALPIEEQTGTACCYAESDKYWTTDPQGVAWESFRTLATIPVFGAAKTDQQSSACCAPAAVTITPAAIKNTAKGCC